LYLNGPGANRIPAAADISAVCRSPGVKGFQSANTSQGSGVLGAAGAASCCLLHGMWAPSSPRRCQMHRGWTAKSFVRQLIPNTRSMCCKQRAYGSQTVVYSS
jgi:hypothetical protein